jgi:hypothetical protein
MSHYRRIYNGVGTIGFVLLLGTCCGLSSSAFLQDNGQDQWAPLRFFLGSWTGTAKGEPGYGLAEREYRFVLAGSFLEVINKTSYEPQEKNPSGELHEDYGLIGYDRVRKTFVLRQFHAEGFVNQYVLDSVWADGNTIVFVTETIENIPSGWKARETYRIVDDDQFVETFELARPGKEFELYSETHMRRKP